MTQNIFCLNENVAVLQDTLNRELATLFEWFSINKLSLKLGKTNDMLFRRKPPDIELHLKINSAEIPKVTTTKFLVIVNDDRLNGKPHIQSVESKLSSILYIMYKASTLITTDGMYTLYCSLFQPYISYCNDICGNHYPSNVKCLCIIQGKAVRLICNAERLAHTIELFKELYILKFPEFVQCKTAILMFHLFDGTLPIHLQNRFTIYSTSRSTLLSNTFVTVQARTNIKEMCLSV